MLPDLPVSRCAEALAEVILRKGTHPRDRVTIVRGPAGSGKSTIPPIVLARRGVPTMMAEPTKLGVFSLSNRVAELMQTPLGELVGYRHSGGQLYGPNTKVLYVPTATAFNQLVFPRRAYPWTLCIDEAHLSTKDIEFSFAVAKKRLQTSRNFRLFVSSATIDTDALSVFFDYPEVFTIEGRNFQVVEMPPVGDLVECVLWGIKEGRNVLFFERGAEQIHEWLRKIDAALSQQGLSASTHALYSNANPASQRECFERSSKLKIIGATNYAETSVTLPYIGLVVDTGVCNRIEVHEGVEGLYARAISNSSRKQRMCRTGREIDGIYMDLSKPGTRDEYDAPEITRSFLSGHLLRVIAAGRKFESLEFLHAPPQELVTDGFEELRVLRFVDKDRGLTESGKRAAFLGVEPSSAAMLLEADSRGVLEDVIPIVALREAGGLSAKRRPAADADSDLIAETALFKKLLESGGQYCQEHGVNQTAYTRVADAHRVLTANLNADRSFRVASNGRRSDVLCSVLAGQLQHLYRVEGGRARKVGGRRACTIESGLRLRDGEIVVGEPRDTQLQGEERYSMRRSLKSVTRIGPAWLTEVAEHLVEGAAALEQRYDPTLDRVVSTTSLTLFGEEIALAQSSAAVEVDENSSTLALAKWLAAFLCGDMPAKDLMNAKPNTGLVAAQPSGKTLLDYRRNAAETEQQNLTAKAEQEQKHRLAQRLEEYRRQYAAKREQIQKLNKLAGKVVHPELTPETVLTHISSAIKGVTHLAGFKRWSEIRAPAIDDAIATQVALDNPSSLELPSGRRVQIDYTRGSKPQVSVSDWWRELPDHPVRLPGGREIEFIIFGSISSSSDLIALKRQAESRGY